MSAFPEEMEKQMPRSSSKTEQLNNLTKAERKEAKAEKKRIRRSAWVDEDLREIEICKGVTIDQSVYQIGVFVAGGGFGFWTAVAILVDLWCLWMIFRPARKAVSGK